MKVLPYILITWLIYAGIATILSSPIIYLSRKRTHWQTYELLMLIIPFGIWFALCSFIGIRSQTLSNAAVEPAILGLAVPIAAFVRVGIGARISERACVTGLIAMVSVVAVGLYFLFPSLPE